MTTKQERVSDITEKLEDLIVQATTEHSHYYVASVCREALKELQTLRAVIPKVRAALEMIHCEGRVSLKCPDGIDNCAVNHMKYNRQAVIAKEALTLLYSLEADK